MGLSPKRTVLCSEKKPAWMENVLVSTAILVTTARPSLSSTPPARTDSILEGDHIPTGANGLNSAPFNPQHSAAPAPAPTAAPAFQPAPVTAAPIQPALQAIPDYDYVDAPVDPNFNPFINPHDPTHRNFQFNANAAKFAPNNPITAQLASVPPCADCSGVHPSINPFAFTTTAPAPRRFFPPGQLNLNRFETGFNF